MTTTELAGAADFDAALRVWQRANAARGKPPGPQRIARVEEKLADPEALVVVARRDGAVAGMALAEPAWHEADLSHLSMLFVEPGLWGAGIGRAVLQAVIAAAAGQSRPRMQVWTGSANQRAKSLYQSAGFTPTGQVKHLESGEQILHLLR